MATKGALTYETPGFNELIGGYPVDQLPSWVFEQQYKSLPQQLEVADQLDKQQFEAERRARQQEAITAAQDIFAPAEDGTKKPLDVGLGELEGKLYEMGVFNDALDLTGRRQAEQSQKIQLQKLEAQEEERRRRESQPRYAKFGDMIFRQYPDGRLEADRPVPRVDRTDRAKPLRPSQIRDDLEAEEDIQRILKERADALEPPSPGILERASAWLSGMVNQPTVNPRARAVELPKLDTGAAISGSPNRRVITLRKRNIEE